MIYTYVDCRITGIEEYAFTVTALKATKVIKQMNEYEFLEEIKPLYRSGTVNSNMVDSKFHFIRSFCEMFSYHFMFKMHG